MKIELKVIWASVLVLALYSFSGMANAADVTTHGTSLDIYLDSLDQRLIFKPVTHKSA